MVPKIIHQIWVNAGMEAPEDLVEYANEIKEMNPDFEYMYWDESCLEEFGLQDDIDKYSSVAHFVNILKIKILEKYGGFYIDFDTKGLKPLAPLYDKYKNYKLSSGVSGTIVDLGYIMAEPGIDYYMFYVDLDRRGPGAFYWQRMKPVKILKSEVGIDGEYLKDLRLNSWC